MGVQIVRFEPENQPRARSVALVLVDPERFNPEAGFGRFQYIEGEGDNLKGYEALRARRQSAGRQHHQGSLRRADR